MQKNNLLILRLNYNDIEISNLQKVGAAYQFAAPQLTDKEVGAEKLRQQLLNLALRKSGLQKPEGAELDKLMQAVDTCRKELTQYDSEIALPDGRIVEIEQYEYENAVLAITNQIVGDIRTAAPNQTIIERVIIIADEVDIPLLRSIFIRIFATAISGGRSDTEWLIVNDNISANNALAEARRNMNTHTAGPTDKNQQTTSKSKTSQSATASSQQTASANGQDVEGAYTGRPANGSRQTQRETANRRTTRSSSPSRPTVTANNNMLIIIGAVIVAIIVGAIGLFIVSNIVSSKKHKVEYRYETPESTDASADEATVGDVVETPVSESSESTTTGNSYDYIYTESGGLRKVSKNDKYGFIDANGREVIPPVYDYVYSSYDDAIKVEKNNKKGLISKQGKIIIPVEYDYIYGKSDNLYKVEKNGKKGYLRADGTVLVQVKYDYIYGKSDGMYKVEVDGKKGFVDANTGNEICAPVYDYIYSFSGGLAKVEKDGKTGYINKQGKLVQPME